MNTKLWLQKGLDKGLTDVEIYASVNDSVKVVVYDGKVEENTVSNVSSVSIRGIYNGKIGKVKFEHVSDEQVDKMLDQLIDNAKAITVDEPAIIYEGSETYPEVKPNDFDFSSVPMKRKVDDLKLLEKTIKDNEQVSAVQSTVYQENNAEAILTNTKGLHLERKNRFAYAYSIGVFGDEEDKATAMEFDVFKTYDTFDPQAFGEKIIDKGLKKLGGRSIETKAYPVVFSNETFSSLLGVFSSLFSQESALRNLTPFKDKIGTSIFQKDINIIDHPLHESAYFQYPFDDEGVACEKKHIVENGVFKGFVNDLKTATMFNQKPTGNSFNGGISMTNIYLEPTDVSFDDMIASIDDGVYITSLVGLHAGVKQVSGEFSLQASGFKIKDGQLDHAVKMIVVSGNFFEALNQVKGIANDLKFSISGTGSPSVYIESLSISGESK